VFRQAFKMSKSLNPYT